MTQHRINHLGVIVKRWPRGRRFQARSIFQDSKYSNQAALLPDGSVAWTGDNVFRYAYTHRNGGEFQALTEALWRLGCLSLSVYREETERCRRCKEKNDKGEAAYELSRAAKTLGMPLETFQIQLLKQHGVKDAHRA